MRLKAKTLKLKLGISEMKTWTVQLGGWLDVLRVCYTTGPSRGRIEGALRLQAWCGWLRDSPLLNKRWLAGSHPNLVLAARAVQSV